MIVSLGFIRSAGQIVVRELNWLQQSIDSKIIDSVELPELNLGVLFIQDEEHFQALAHTLEKEKVYYPIVDAAVENLTLSKFEELGANQLKELYLRVSHRATLQQNLNSVEHLWKINNHFRELWVKDRLSFFEELWYWMKRNLATTDLSIIFHDVVKTEEKDENNEKKERPKLTQALLSGTKKANFIQGGAKEKELMNSYLEKFHDVFEVTEFNPQKGQFVATAQVQRSPIIFMARIPELNQLQRTLLASVFNGLQNL